MHLGIGSYTFTWAIGVPGHQPKEAMSVFGLISEAERLGVDVVQFCDNLPLTALSNAELERLEGQSRHLGIALELGTRGLEPERLRAYLRLCQRLGVSFLRLVLDQPGDEPSPEEAVARLRPICREFAAEGIRLAIENHDRFSTETLAGMIDQLGREQVGICLDTVNSFGALETPASVVRRLAPFALCLHIKDFTVRRVSHQMGFVVEGCPAGQGRLNVPLLLAEVQQHCPNANAILETWVTPSDSLAETIARERSWTDQGVEFLRTLIPGEGTRVKRAAERRTTNRSK
ncbi:MAG: sugar phosphate isomerase/epimerase family protein [Verrucomicrobiota bacterium]